MAQPSPEEEKILVTQEANELLLKLSKSYLFLQRLNKDIESRPFSTRIHGQFDHELKKSQNIISKLSSLLRRYHSFEFSSSLSLQINSDDNNNSNKPIDEPFLIEFKDICLKIEREWRIGSRLINEFQSKYGQNINNIDDHYHSDTDARYQHRKKFKDKSKNKTHSRSRSGSIGSKSANGKSKSVIRSNSNSPIHTFSNPNSPLFTHRNNTMSQSAILSPNKTMNHGMSSLNIGLSQSQVLQQRQKYAKDSNYHSKIGQEFVPYDEEEKLNKQIRDINDDLQYLLDINQQVNSLVNEQKDNVDDMERKVSSAQDNVKKGMDTLTSIRKSPWTYGIVGGLGFAALGGAGPVILAGAGMKAAIGGALGLGTVGAYSGAKIANKQNEKIEDDNQRDKEVRLLHDEMEKKQNEENKNKNKNKKGFQTKPTKRNNTGWLGWYGNTEDDDDEDIDEWDARN